MSEEQARGPEDGGPSDTGPGDAGPGGPVDDGDRGRGPRRRGRRGRGAPPPFRPAGAAPFRPAAPAAPRGFDEEGSQQASEIAAYERRQMRQENRGWRPPTSVGQWGQRPAAPRPGFASRPSGPGGFRGAPQGSFRPGGTGFRPQTGGFRPGGPGRGPAAPLRGRGRPAPAYQDQVRRMTGGSQTGPAIEAGEPLAGPHAVLEAIRSGRLVRKLYVSQDRGLRTGAVNELILEAQQRRIFVNFVDKLDLARVSPIEEHQGVVAIVEGRKGVDLDELMLHLDTLEQAPLVLIVDSLQDPQNFGVLLRSAEGAGVDGVVIPRNRAVGVTAAVTKTSAGASEHLLIADVVNLRQAIDTLKEKGIWVIGADETGEMLYDEADYRSATAIVIGGEGEGIRRLVLEGCDEVVRIPMEGKISSLNAASAGTVLLYEALRQRRRDAAPPETRTPRPEQPEAARPELGSSPDSLAQDTEGLEADVVDDTPAADDAGARDDAELSAGEPGDLELAVAADSATAPGVTAKPRKAAAKTARAAAPRKRATKPKD